MSGTNDGRVRHKFGDLLNKSGNSSGALAFGNLWGQAAGRKNARPLTKNEQRDRGEEERLLGSSSRPDPKGVAILPGASLQRSKIGANLGQFRPWNTIDERPTISSSLNKPNHQIYASRSAVGRAQTDKNSFEHRRKKQKLGIPAHSASVIEIVDEDNSPVPVTASQVTQTPADSRRPRCPSSTVSHGLESPRVSSKTSEYWEVEGAIRPPTVPPKTRQTRSGRRRGSSDVEVDLFTRHAREERINRERPERFMGSQPGVHYMDSVVIPRSPSDRKRGSSPPCDQSVSGADERRDITGRESPDELQGGRTMDDFWRSRAEVKRQASPSDIIPTLFSPVFGKRSRNSGQRTNVHKELPTGQIFAIHMFRSDSSKSNQPLELVLSEDGKTFLVRLPKGSTLREFDVTKINRIFHNDDPGNRKIRLMYPKSHGSYRNCVDIEFANDEGYCSFSRTIFQTSNAKRISCEKAWMDRMFSRAMAEDQPSPPAAKQETRELEMDKRASPRPPKPKRLKLSESLQNGNDMLDRVPTEKPKAGNEVNQRNFSQRDESSGVLNHAHPSPAKSDAGVDIPVKTHRPTATLRQTRSQAKLQNYILDSDKEDPPTSTSSPKDQDGKWTRPLVYPKVGKKKAEVEAQDLARLRDDEFLNDNLIGFYIRFLEHHLERANPELATKVYFFNSYFFASLTNKPKGTRGINYQGVAKWTRSVDLFSYDYVVIPINESAHWYIAIICNLPNLIRMITEGESIECTQEDDSQKGVPQDVRPPLTTVSQNRDIVGDSAAETSVESGKSDRLRESFSLMTLSDPAPASPREYRTSQEQEDWPDELENQKHSSPTIPMVFKHTESKEEAPTEEHGREEEATTKSENLKLNRKRTKKPRPPVQKYDPRQPVILTFDSLGCQRSHTVRILKDYLEEEAKSKRSITFDSKIIKGMTARGIPLQPNFSDCGLYLLAYLEKFIQDPDDFVTKLLRREMKEDVDWPRMKSGVFRRRLHQFLLDLYEEQYGSNSDKSEKGRMVDTKPLHILLVPDEPAMNTPQPKSPEPERSSSNEPKSQHETPNGARKEPPNTAELTQQPTTPTHSTPLPNHHDDPDIQRSISPVAVVDKREIVRSDDEHDHRKFIDELREMINAPTERKHPDPNQDSVPSISETSPRCLEF